VTTYGPYTPVRKAGNILFISCQVVINATTKAAAEDITQQTIHALKNIERVLQDVGAQLQDVVKTTVYLTTMDHFEKMNAAYEQIFIVPRPARSTVAVRELPRIAGTTSILVEIEAVAYVGSK
jgi:2-iminobutanoate/2-iminopropanoate deaminase